MKAEAAIHLLSQKYRHDFLQAEFGFSLFHNFNNNEVIKANFSIELLCFFQNTLTPQVLVMGTILVQNTLRSGLSVYWFLFSIFWNVFHVVTQRSVVHFAHALQWLCIAQKSKNSLYLKNIIKKYCKAVLKYFPLSPIDCWTVLIILLKIFWIF